MGTQLLLSPAERLAHGGTVSSFLAAEFSIAKQISQIVQSRVTVTHNTKEQKFRFDYKQTNSVNFPL